LSTSAVNKAAEVSGKAYDSADQMTGGKVTEVTELAKNTINQLASFGSSWFASAT
jgi:hypothetical protein